MFDHETSSVFFRATFLILVLLNAIEANLNTGGVFTPTPCVDGDCMTPHGLLEARVKRFGATDVVITLHVVERIDLPSDCERLEFENVGKHTENTLFSNTFTVYDSELDVGVLGDTTNLSSKTSMPTFTNGREFLSFISKGSAPKGTWIVGDTPGQDRGFIFADVNHATRVPVGLLGWKWLLRNQWEDDEDVRVTCTSAAAPRVGHFYVVEVLAESLSALSMGQDATGVFSAHLLFVESTGSWILDLDGVEVPLESVAVLAEVGEVLHLSSTKGKGLLLKIDGLAAGWELLLHRLDGDGGEERVLVSDFTETVRKVPWEKDKVPVSSLLFRASPGDYLWVWYRGPELRDTNTHHGGPASSVHETLLLCVSPGVFRFFPANREAAMRQKELGQDIDLVTLSPSGEHLHLPPLSSSFKVRARPTGVVNLGKADDVLRFLERHLVAVDSTAAAAATFRPSACFFYHASLSIPAPLVYAAEIVCLVIGAKPVVMSQYDTPSEKQWKAPLVRPLLRGLTALVAKNDSSMKTDLNLEVFRFGSDTSLVLFRESRRYLAEALLPFKQTQALHPVPYPNEAGDKAQLQRDHHDQIYNSAWNGYVLGYPRRFVDMYCEDFHNPLSVKEKMDIAREARANLESAFRQEGHALVEIGGGLDAPLDTNSMNLLYAAVLV